MPDALRYLRDDDRRMRTSPLPTTLESEHTLADAAYPATGQRYLSATGRVWTVQGVTRRGQRVVLINAGPDGSVGSVVDMTALDHMTHLPDNRAEALPPPTAAPEAVRRSHPRRTRPRRAVDRHRSHDVAREEPATAPA
jgi:hypothetical protein